MAMAATSVGATVPLLQRRDHSVQFNGAEPSDGLRATATAALPRRAALAVPSSSAPPPSPSPSPSPASSSQSRRCAAVHSNSSSAAASSVSSGAGGGRVDGASPRRSPTTTTATAAVTASEAASTVSAAAEGSIGAAAAVKAAEEGGGFPRVGSAEVEALQELLGNSSPLAIVTKALEMYGSDAAIAFSGAEDVALIELASMTGLPFRVFCLDTGRLNPETYRYLHKVEQHYGIRIEVMFPDAAAVQRLVHTKGLFSFYEDGHQECCSIRKVEPLKRALRGLGAWITGQRRDQSLDTRAAVPVVQLDAAFEGRHSGEGQALVKFNPLACWSSRAVWALLEAQQTPVNELHARGFTSIGCEPCTRPVLPHQHEREGRWWWESAAAKECGLHKAPPTAPGAAADAASTNGAAAATPTAAAASPAQAVAVAPAVAATATPLSATGSSSGSGTAAAAAVEWPDLYVSPDIATFMRDDVDALLDGSGWDRVGMPSSSSDSAAAAAAPPGSWLLVVYAPWCRFCQALEPALQDVAQRLHQQRLQLAHGDGHISTRFAGVAKLRGDGELREYVREKLGVESFPSIFVVRPIGGAARSGAGAVDSGAGAGAVVVKRRSERRDADALELWVRTLQ